MALEVHQNLNLFPPPNHPHNFSHPIVDIVISQAPEHHLVVINQWIDPPPNPLRWEIVKINQIWLKKFLSILIKKYNNNFIWEIVTKIEIFERDIPLRRNLEKNKENYLGLKLRRRY